MDDNEFNAEPEETGKKKLRLFIVDNQPLYRRAIFRELQQEVEVVGESPIIADVCNLVEDLLPDIALVDVGLPSLAGLGVARTIARRCPGVAVVMLSANPDSDQLFQAIKSGVVAFLSKEASTEQIAGTIRQVGRGQYPINDSLLDKPNTAGKILELFHHLSSIGDDAGTLVTPLSPRETEVLKYIAEGNSNKRIASALGVSEQTVKNYITTILRKLNANDRTHAVVLAMRKHWLKIDESALARLEW